jgi:hypothetical protein
VTDEAGNHWSHTMAISMKPHRRRGLASGVHVGIGLALALLPGARTAEGEDRPEWDDPQVIQVNAQAPRSTFLPFDGRDRALEHADSPGASSRYFSLSGRWRFHLAENPASRPVGFFEPDFDASDWAHDHRSLELADPGVRCADLHERAIPLPDRRAAGAAGAERGRVVPAELLASGALGVASGFAAADLHPLRRR